MKVIPERPILIFKAIFCLMLMCFLFVSAEDAKSMTKVYIPTILSVKEKEKILEQDAFFKNLHVEVFAKFNDFQHSVSIAAPAILIAPFDSSEQFRGYEKAFQFYEKQSDSREYILIRLKSKEFNDPIEQGSIGLLDEVGRKNMKSFADRIFPTLNIKNIKKVSKPEDLFAMLILGNVDFVMISHENLLQLKKDYATEIAIVQKSTPVKYPVILIKSNAMHLKDEIKKMKEETMIALGFDEIREIKREEDK